MSGIIVGVDGSDCSLRALDWAAREAAIRHVPLDVVTIVHAVAEYWGGPVPADADVAEQARKQAEAELDGVLGKIGAQSRPDSITVTAVAGRMPADVLQELGVGADLLVVGARGAGGFRQLPLGSVSTPVTHHARCPVVVIPADEG
jgi:nucleotide-binding universal stress UspA family protein